MADEMPLESRPGSAMKLESDKRTYLEASGTPNAAVAVTVGADGQVSETKLKVYAEQGNHYVAIAETPEGRTQTADVKVYSEGVGSKVAVTQDADGKTRVAEAATGIDAALAVVAGMKFPDGVALSEGGTPAVVPNEKSGGIAR